MQSDDYMLILSHNGNTHTHTHTHFLM